MRWDAKRKKYLPTMVTADGKALKGQRRNESGKKVKGDGETLGASQIRASRSDGFGSG